MSNIHTFYEFSELEPGVKTIDQLLAKRLEFGRIRYQLLLVSKVVRIASQRSILQGSAVAAGCLILVEHHHISGQMHDIRSRALVPDLDAVRVNAGIRIHGTLVYLVIIL